MDIWFVFLWIAFLIGILGWPISSLFCNAVLWYCDFQDGTENNWGSNVFWLLMYPASLTFAWMEIILLYVE
ncbi:hypothetical protein GC174_07045 [bacterium]|nr:hypothetical protein [bacterium]